MAVEYVGFGKSGRIAVNYEVVGGFCHSVVHGNHAAKVEFHIAFDAVSATETNGVAVHVVVHFAVFLSVETEHGALVGS